MYIYIYIYIYKTRTSSAVGGGFPSRCAARALAATLDPRFEAGQSDRPSSPLLYLQGGETRLKRRLLTCLGGPVRRGWSSGSKRASATAHPLRCCTWKGEFKLLWREAGPPNHHDEKVDLDQ